MFIVLGLSATALGKAAFHNQVTITRLSGVIVIAMALYMLGSLVLRAPGLYQERRWHPDLSRFGPFAAPVAGVAFGFGWTPCIGPVLGTILGLAYAQGTVAKGVVLLVCYSLGLGVPFFIASLAMNSFLSASRGIRRHLRTIEVASGVVIEDAPAGVRAGVAAGAATVAVTNTQTAETLRDAGADLVLPTLAGLTVDQLEALIKRK